MNRIKIQINSDRFNGEIRLIPTIFRFRGSWEQKLNPNLTSTNDRYLSYSYYLPEFKLSLEEKMGDMPLEALVILLDFNFFEVGKTGKGYKKAHKYSSGQQIDADIPLTWKHLGFN